MSSEIETERRFLLKSLPENLTKYPRSRIEDIKIITGEPHPHLRLRRKDEKFVLTKKYRAEGTSGQMQMIEEHIDLNEAEYNAISKIHSTSLSKYRYFYNLNGFTAEIDVFDNDLKGLVIMEVEFGNESDARNFVMPEICLCEITGIEALAGGILSGKNYDDISSELDKYEYKPLYL